MTTTTQLDEWLACSACGHADTLDGFDVLGADEDNVFCNKCTAEVSLESLKEIDPAPYLLAELADKYPGLAEPLGVIAAAYDARQPAVKQAELF